MISDKYTNPPTEASLVLSQVRQQGVNIKGSVAVGAGLLSGSTFSGAVTSDRKIQFTVPGVNGLAPLLFTGQVQTDDSLSGTYCSYRGNTICDHSLGGWGDWHTSPPQKGPGSTGS